MGMAASRPPALASASSLPPHPRYSHAASFQTRAVRSHAFFVLSFSVWLILTYFLSSCPSLATANDTSTALLPPSSTLSKPGSGRPKDGRRKSLRPTRSRRCTVIWRVEQQERPRRYYRRIEDGRRTRRRRKHTYPRRRSRKRKLEWRLVRGLGHPRWQEEWEEQTSREEGRRGEGGKPVWTRREAVVTSGRRRRRRLRGRGSIIRLRR